MRVVAVHLLQSLNPSEIKANLFDTERHFSYCGLQSTASERTPLARGNAFITTERLSAGILGYFLGSAFAATYII